MTIESKLLIFYSTNFNDLGIILYSIILYIKIHEICYIF